MVPSTSSPRVAAGEAPMRRADNGRRYGWAGGGRVVASTAAWFVVTAAVLVGTYIAAAFCALARSLARCCA